MANLTSGHPCLVGRDEPSHQCTQRHRLKIGNEDQLNIEQKNRICDLCLLNVPETECHFWNTWEYWAWFSRIPAGLIVAFHTPIPVPVNHKTWLMEDQNNEIQQLTVFYMLVLSISNATPTQLGVCCNDCRTMLSWWNIYHCDHLYIAIHKMKHMFHGSEHFVFILLTWTPPDTPLVKSIFYHL